MGKGYHNCTRESELTVRIRLLKIECSASIFNFYLYKGNMPGVGWTSISSEYSGGAYQERPNTGYSCSIKAS